MHLKFLNKESLIGIFCIPITWFLCADIFHLASPLLLPTLQDVLAKLFQLLLSGDLFVDLWSTLFRWILGFSLGVFFGIIIGLLFGLYQGLYRTFELPIEFFRSLPITAIFPLFLIIFGIGDSAKIAMAFLPTFLLMLVNTSYGVSQASPERRRMAKVFGATPWQLFRLIVAYEALPQIFIGLRLSLSLSLIVIVVSEMFIGTDFGLGQRVYDSYLTNSVSTLYALLLVLGILGYTLNKILIFIEHRYVFWAGK